MYPRVEHAERFSNRYARRQRLSLAQGELIRVLARMISRWFDKHLPGHSPKEYQRVSYFSAIAQPAPHARADTKQHADPDWRHRPLARCDSPAPQLITANSITQRRATLPHVTWRARFWLSISLLLRLAGGDHSHYASDNATMRRHGTARAAVVRPEPCLTSWKPVFRCNAAVRGKPRVSTGCAVWVCSKRTWHPPALRRCSPCPSPRRFAFYPHAIE